MKTLETMATKYLKKWSGLCQSADTAHLYLPNTNGGLGLPAISLVSLLLTSRDPLTQQVARGMLQWEERPVTHYRQATMSEDSGASNHTLIWRVKARLALEDAETRQEQARSLPKQGQLLREENDAGAHIWALAVSSLPSERMKFALNSAPDTLSHKTNLSLWRGLNDSCKLCGEKQTLSLDLNHCKVALKLRCYNNSIFHLIRPSTLLPDDIRYQLIVTFPESHCSHGPETRHSVVVRCEERGCPGWANYLLWVSLLTMWRLKNGRLGSIYLGLVEEVEDFERLRPHLSDSHHKRCK